MLTRESRATIGGPGCAYRGPVLPRGGPARLIHPGRIIFPCRMVPLELPMWWGRALFTVWLGNDVRASRLHSVVRGTPDSGYRQGLNLNRSKELECAVDWRTGFSGVPPDSVRCTWAVQVPTSHRLGKTQVRSAIIHRNVRCTTRLSGELAGNGYPAPTVDCKSTCHSEQCEAESEQRSQRGTGLSGVARGQSPNGRLGSEP